MPSFFYQNAIVNETRKYGDVTIDSKGVSFETDQYELNQWVPTHLHRFVDGVPANTDLVTPETVTAQEIYSLQVVAGAAGIGAGEGGGPITANSIQDATTAGKALLTAASAVSQRTALGLGTAALSAATAFATAAQGAKADTAVQLVKTINGQSIVGTGDITISGGSGGGAVDSVAGKTGVVTLVKGDVGLGNVDNTSDANKPVSSATQTALNAKQATLVSNTNIKTVNGQSLLGAGDIVISGSGGSSVPNYSNDVTAGRALVAGDLQSTLIYNAAGNANFQIPLDSALGLSGQTNNSIEIFQKGNGVPNIVAGAGVTLIKWAGYQTSALGVTQTAHRVGVNTWAVK